MLLIAIPKAANPTRRCLERYGRNTSRRRRARSDRRLLGIGVDQIDLASRVDSDSQRRNAVSARNDPRWNINPGVISRAQDEIQRPYQFFGLQKPSSGAWLTGSVNFNALLRRLLKTCSRRRRSPRIRRPESLMLLRSATFLSLARN